MFKMFSFCLPFSFKIIMEEEIMLPLAMPVGRLAVFESWQFHIAKVI